MLVTVVVPVVVLAVIVALGWTWYRRKVAGLAPDAAPREIRGTRLTAERLRMLPTPPWRVVYEIAPTTLGSIDHVVIGTGGAIAVETLIGDRPDTAPSDPGPDTAREGGAAHTSAMAAIARDDVDTLLGPGASCSVLAKVYWGTPDPARPPAVEVTAGLVAVEGQRLMEWLTALAPGELTASQVDLAWQQLVMGIGRPDPLP